MFQSNSISDYIYIEVINQTPTTIGFNLLTSTKDITGKFLFENVSLADIRTVLNKAYNNEDKGLLSYSTNGAITYHLFYNNSYATFSLNSNPTGIKVDLSEELSSLLLEKFSRLLNDNKNKM